MKSFIKYFVCLANALLSTSACFADEPAVAHNAVLMQLFVDDQTDRNTRAGKPWTSEMTARDQQRRSAAKHELAAGKVRTGADYFNIAMLFQHGNTPDDYRLAYSLAWISFSMHDPDSVPASDAAWLSSAAWDRLLLSLGKKQWYKTQAAIDPTTKLMGKILPYDPTAASAADVARFKMLPVR